MKEEFISNNEKTYRQIHELKKKWYKKWWGVLLLSVLFLLLVFLTASAIFIIKQASIYNEFGYLGEANQDLTLYSPEQIEGKNSYYFGAKNPEITIVEFSDFACPNCRNFYEKTKKLRTKYYSDIKIIHRDFPVVSDYSTDLALAARCAGEQGLFWKAHDELYENQGIKTKEEIYSLMLSVGVDGSRLLECLEQNRYLPQIQKDLADGLALEIIGTPTWFINGYRADGDMPEEMLNEIVENFLINN